MKVLQASGNVKSTIDWIGMKPGSRILLSRTAEYLRQQASRKNAHYKGERVYRVRVNRETDQDGLWLIREI